VSKFMLESSNVFEQLLFDVVGHSVIRGGQRGLLSRD
jgi:hypothetical protein